jgi:hypothetical protein
MRAEAEGGGGDAELFINKEPLWMCTFCVRERALNAFNTFCLDDFIARSASNNAKRVVVCWWIEARGDFARSQSV